MGSNGSYHLKGNVFDFYFLDHGLDIGVFKLRDGMPRYNVLMKEASEADMLPLCRENGSSVSRYVLDLSDARFVDSSAFGVIVDVMDEARKRGLPETQIVVHNDEAAEIMKLLDFSYSKTQKGTIPGVTGEYTALAPQHSPFSQ